VDSRHRCELVELMDFGPARHAVIEVPLLVVHEYVRTVRGGNLDGAVVELRYAAPAYYPSYAHYFACPVRCNAPRNAFDMPAAWLAESNAGHDESAWRMALLRCEQTSTLPREQDTLCRVHHEIRSAIDAAHGPAGAPRLPAIADRLHVSPRTLIRRLREAGTTYQSIVDDIQKSRARDLLADRANRVCDVATTLGFQDPASFGRSFKRWFGTTPGAYRGASAPAVR
jgi:AraC-like DNA-binding protein